MKSFLISAILILFSCSTFAQIQIGQDIDGEAVDDMSGWSTSLSSDGSIVAIGSWLNDGNGDRSGHVRVYQFKSFSNSWIQLGQDINGEAAEDFSGTGISLSSDGSILAIGAWANECNFGDNSGHVRVYQFKSDTWRQLGKDIDAEAEMDAFGEHVSLSSDGSIVAIGAVFNDGNGTSSGHVRVYQFLSDTWEQLGQDIDGESADDLSGYGLSLSSDGSIVAIGAQSNADNGRNSGHVRVYQFQSDTWKQLGQDIDGEATGDASGNAVSLSSDGSIVAIGAPGNQGNGNFSGHVRVYKFQSGTWTQLGRDIDGKAENDRLGHHLSLSSDGTILAVASEGNTNSAGRVEIYQFQSDTWGQIGKDIIGEAKEDRSGSSISLSSDGGIVAIGAHGNDGNGSNSGHVRVYKVEGGNVAINNINTWFIIYPNPSTNELKVKIESNLLNSTYGIYNPLGQKVSEGRLTKKISIIDVSKLPKGNYVLQIGESYQLYKFMVQ